MAKLFVAQACAGETLVLEVTVSVAMDVVVNVEVWVFVMITEDVIVVTAPGVRV